MGRPSSGKTETIILRCTRELVALVDLCAAREGDAPNRSEMARRLIETEANRRAREVKA